jgi:hypothetical protein
VESLYIETAEGERFKLPFTKLSGGRAMVEHVRQGGRPYDLRGQHITSMVEEINVLSRFRRANHGKIFEGDTEQLVAETNAYYENVSRALKGLGTNRGYNQYFESWNPAEVSEQDMVIEDIKNLFVTQNIDSRIEAALPVLARIQQQGQAMKEAQIFEQWINNITEGTWALPETPEQKEKLGLLLSKELIVGADATNATEQLYDLVGDDELFDILSDLAQRDADANAWDDSAVMNRLHELAEMDSDLAEVLDVVHQQSAPAHDEENLDEYQINDLGEGLLDTIASKLGHGSDEDMLKDLQRKAGLPVTGKKPGEESDTPAHDEHEVDEGDVTRTPTGLVHRATDRYGADDETHHYTGGKSGFSEPGKYARDLEHVNKQLVKDLDASMGITWKNRGTNGVEVDEGIPLGHSKDPEQGKWYHEGRKAYKFGTTSPSGLIQDIAKKHNCPPEWVKAFHAGYEDQAGWGKEDMAEGYQLDEGIMDSLNGIINKIKMTPGIQKFIGAAKAKQDQLIQALQHSANGKDLVANIQQAVGGQQAVAEGLGQKIGGAVAASAGAGLLAGAADIMMRAYIAMGKPDLTQMMNDPNGKNAVLLVGWLIVLGALAMLAGGSIVKKGMDNEDMAEEINSLRRAAGLTENVTLDESGQTFQHILDTFKRDIKDFKASGALSDHLYDALFDYYAPDMPYGVAKARSGDPYKWIADRFGSDIGMLNFNDKPEETESMGDYAEEVTPEAIAPVLECNMTPFGSQCPVHGIEECVTAGLMEETADKFDLGRLKVLANIR